MITSQNRPGLPDFSHVTLKNMGRPGDEANSGTSRAYVGEKMVENKLAYSR